MSLFDAYRYAESGPTCCELMRDALRATRDTDRPRGLRRRAMMDADEKHHEVLVLYSLGKRDALVVYCPFCGKKQDTKKQRTEER